MEIEDTKAEWKQRFEKEKEGFVQAAIRNRTKVNKPEFDLPNIMDFKESYLQKKEVEEIENADKYKAGASKVSIFISGTTN